MAIILTHLAHSCALLCTHVNLISLVTNDSGTSLNIIHFSLFLVCIPHTLRAPSLIYSYNHYLRRLNIIRKCQELLPLDSIFFAYLPCWRQNIGAVKLLAVKISRGDISVWRKVSLTQSSRIKVPTAKSLLREVLVAKKIRR